MKRLILCFSIIFAFAIAAPVFAAEPDSFDMEAQLDALGANELMEQVPEEARELLRQAEIDDISTGNLLSLSPGKFFAMLWQMFVGQIRRPLVVLGTILGVIILCAMLDGMKTAMGEDALSPVFSTVSVMCILTSIAMPILNCIIDTSRAIQMASKFMLSFIPVFSASMIAAGHPVSGATYNLFLFGTCQAVAQVVAQTLVPLMGIFLALCIVGAIVPEINIASATATIKSIVSWVLGFISAVFVGLLSVQSMVAGSADNVTTRTAKFLIGSFVPVVGSALSDAYSAAHGCLRMLKTSLGAYGILVAALTFLPILIQIMIWFGLTNLAVIGSDLLGVPRIAGILKSCSSVLGILMAVIVCYALLIIVSTTVILVTGMGG